MSARSKIFSIPVSIDDMMVFDLFYAHGTSMATQIGLALSHPAIIQNLDASDRIAASTEYVPSNYINIITEENV